MTNDLFRDRLVAKIKAAKVEYDNTKKVDHPYMKGRIREIVVQNLIRPLLSQEFQIGNGKITDKNGVTSAETDVIIYSNKLIPPILYEERLGIFPIDSCVACVEVKSVLDATEIDNTIKNAVRLRTLQYSSGKFDPTGKQLASQVGVVTRSLFAFESDLTEKSEFVRYGERDTKYKTCPEIKAFCVMGRGAWCFNTQLQKWLHVEHTSDYDEVISFLTSIVVDNLFPVLESRGRPKIGPYVTKPAEQIRREDTGSSDCQSYC